MKQDDGSLAPAEVKLPATILRRIAMVSSWRVQQAAREVRAGAVIAYPTEAVWGLGCDPWNEEAVYRLLAIKSRPVEKGLILIADNIRQFDFLFEDFPELWMDRMASTWPGPNTWLVPHQNLLPEWITGVHETVALRVTDHPTVRELCALVGPLISTSANPAGRPSARSRLRVEQYFRGQIDLVLGGSLGGRRNPSMIRDIATGQVVRPG
jgi:L-threonylcarbamoyladenylate synthase